LPVFATYADYDFRNDQALDMLEELFWESNYSGYNFYDYVTIGKDVLSAQTISPKEFSLEKHFYSPTLGLDSNSKYLTTAVVKDLSLTGSFYTNSVQLEDYSVVPSLLSTLNFSLLPVYSELNEMDDSFSSFKSLSALSNKFSTSTLLVSNPGLAPRSYLSTFNHFRSDYSDFI
jgi:hypothetical protein